MQNLAHNTPDDCDVHAPIETSIAEQDAKNQHIGSLFIEARKELNLSVKAVADKIHVRTLYLEAIEKGEFHRLPSALYAAGFIKLYARYLSLDGEEILRRLSLAKENPLSQSPFIHESSIPKPNRFIITLSLALSFLSLCLIFYIFSTTPKDAPAPFETFPKDTMVSNNTDSSNMTESTADEEDSKIIEDLIESIDGNNELKNEDKTPPTSTPESGH